MSRQYDAPDPLSFHPVVDFDAVHFKRYRRLRSDPHYHFGLRARTHQEHAPLAAQPVRGGEYAVHGPADRLPHQHYRRQGAAYRLLHLPLDDDRPGVRRLHAEYDRDLLDQSTVAPG